MSKKSLFLHNKSLITLLKPIICYSSSLILLVCCFCGWIWIETGFLSILHLITLHGQTILLILLNLGGLWYKMRSLLFLKTLLLIESVTSINTLLVSSCHQLVGVHVRRGANSELKEPCQALVSHWRCSGEAMLGWQEVGWSSRARLSWMWNAPCFESVFHTGSSLNDEKYLLWVLIHPFLSLLPAHLSPSDIAQLAMASG